jgi:hypothetical protein
MDEDIKAALAAALEAHAWPMLPEIHRAALYGGRPVASEALQRRCIAAAVAAFLRSMPSIIDTGPGECAYLSGMTWAALADRVAKESAQ